MRLFGYAPPQRTTTSSREIEIFDEPRSTSHSWRSGEGEWTLDSFLNEEHHLQYGRPWCIGRSYVDYLIERGVKPEHNVLDFGCGAGRVGIWLIPLLHEGRYFGLDRHLGSLEAFVRYEIPLHQLAKYRPRIALGEKLRLDGFGVTFDNILDLHVSHHMPTPDSLRFYEAAAKSLNAGGKVFVSHVPKPSIDSLAAVGLRLVHTEKRPAFLLRDRGNIPSPKGKQWAVVDDHWHVLEKA